MAVAFKMLVSLSHWVGALDLTDHEKLFYGIADENVVLSFKSIDGN